MPIDLDGFSGIACVLLAGGFLELPEKKDACIACKEDESPSFRAWNSYPGRAGDEHCTCGWMTNSDTGELGLAGIVYQVQISQKKTPSVWYKEIRSFKEYSDHVENTKNGILEPPQLKYKGDSWTGEISPWFKEYIEKTLSSEDPGFYEKKSIAQYPDRYYVNDFAFGSKRADEKTGKEILENFLSQ